MVVPADGHSSRRPRGPARSTVKECYKSFLDGLRADPAAFRKAGGSGELPRDSASCIAGQSSHSRGSVTPPYSQADPVFLAPEGGAGSPVSRSPGDKRNAEHGSIARLAQRTFQLVLLNFVEECLVAYV